MITALGLVSAGLAPATAAQGSPTAIGVTRVSKTGPIDSESKNTYVYCGDSGTSRATGGGAEVHGGRGQVRLTRYSTTERDWATADASEDADGTAANWSLTTYAICTTGLGHPGEHYARSAENSTPDRSVTLSCPTGTVVTGGSAEVLGAAGVVLDDVIPSSDMTRLTVGGYEDQTGTTANWSLLADARCVTPLPGQRRIAVSSAWNSAPSKSVTASCASGQVLIGTGSEIHNGRGQVVLDDVVPNAELTSVRVEAFEDQDGTTANWSVTAYAVCIDATY